MDVRAPSGQALVNDAPAGHRPSGFDPSREPLLPIPSLTREQIARFDSNIVEAENGCWIWTGYKNGRAGYFKANGTRYFATRIMFAETYGQEMLSRCFVVKTCGDRACVNPDHLILGNDRTIAEARKSYGGYASWDGKRSGEGNPNARLSDAEANHIKGSDESLRVLAKRYGVACGTIWRIKAGVRRDSDGSGVADKTGTGLAVGDSADPKGIAPQVSDNEL